MALFLEIFLILSIPFWKLNIIIKLRNTLINYKNVEISDEKD